jgi:hypothetical protein
MSGNRGGECARSSRVLIGDEEALTVLTATRESNDRPVGPEFWEDVTAVP